VFSQDMLSVQPELPLSKAMVKFSIGEESLETFMSMRARSLLGPGYAVPHSPVFLLMTSCHLSALGTAKMV